MGRYTGKTCRLSSMLALTFSYFLVELIVGHISHSLALIGDSYHMLSDVVALCVGLASVKISKLHSQKNTYGWARAEVLGALVNSVFLIALCFTVFVEALEKLTTGRDHVDPDKIYLMLIVGIAGLVLNVIGLILFHNHSHGHSHGGGGGHGHSHNKKNKKNTNHVNHDKTEHESLHGAQSGAGGAKSEKVRLGEESGSSDTEDCVGVSSQAVVVTDNSSASESMEEKKPNHSSAQLNMRGVFLHVLGDALGSVGVIISALVILFCTGEWRFYVDPAASMVMVIIIFCTSIRLLKESAFILLQTVPTHIQVSSLKEKLLNKVQGVLAVHEFHVWQLAGNRIIASAHIRCQTPHEYMRIAEEVKSFFHDEGIHSTTVQPEFVEDVEDMKVLTSESYCMFDCNCHDEVRCCPVQPPSTLSSPRGPKNTTPRRRFFKSSSSGPGNRSKNTFAWCSFGNTLRDTQDVRTLDDVEKYKLESEELASCRLETETRDLSRDKCQGNCERKDQVAFCDSSSIVRHESGDVPSVSTTTTVNTSTSNISANTNTTANNAHSNDFPPASSSNNTHSHHVDIHTPRVEPISGPAPSLTIL